MTKQCDRNHGSTNWHPADLRNVMFEFRSLMQTNSDWLQHVYNLSVSINWTAAICKPSPVCLGEIAVSPSRNVIVLEAGCSHETVDLRLKVVAQKLTAAVCHRLQDAKKLNARQVQILSSYRGAAFLCFFSHEPWNQVQCASCFVWLWMNWQ